MRYLMNSISEYFGSGHRSSATIRSSLSATSRTASIAGMTLSRMYFACSRPSSAGWWALASSSCWIAVTNSSTSACGLADQALEAGRAQLAEVADRRGQDHRPGDRRRRLGLDVELRRVLLDEHLEARLELALGQHLVALERR